MCLTIVIAIAIPTAPQILTTVMRLWINLKNSDFANLQ